jgi:hypothetical protein
MPGSARCSWTAAAVCADIYFAALPLSASITAVGLPVWLGGGAALAGLRFLGISYLPVVLAAAWLAAIAGGSGPWAAGLAAAGLLAEASMGYAILRLRLRLSHKFRGVDRLILAALVTSAVPLVGVTRVAAGGGVQQFFAHWRMGWGRDAAGWLFLAPLWTLEPGEAARTTPVVQSAENGLANIHHALAAFETAPRVVLTQTQPEPAHHL